jgi:hypothetical protein
MAQETGSEFTPITFTKTDEVTGVERELAANSPADEVRLRFDGWQEKKTGTGRPAKPATAG